MRFLIDESLSTRLVAILRDAGHECLHANHIGLRGEPDAVIFATAQERKAVLLSRDLDFADITKFPPGTHGGLIVVRMSTEIRNEVLMNEIALRLRTLTESDITGSTVIMEPDRTRIRRKE